MASRDSDSFRFMVFKSPHRIRERIFICDPWREDVKDVVVVDPFYKPEYGSLHSMDGRMVLNMGPSEVLFYGSVAEGCGYIRLEDGDPEGIFFDVTDRYILYLDWYSKHLQVYAMPRFVVSEAVERLPVVRTWSTALMDFGDCEDGHETWVLSRQSSRVFGFNTKKGVCTKLCIRTGTVITRPCARLSEACTVTLPDDDHELWIGKDAVFDGDQRRLTDPELARCHSVPDGSVMVFYKHTPNVVDIIRRPLRLREIWIKRVVIAQSKK